MNNYFIFILAILFITNIINAFIPYLTKKTENFGVSIPENLYNRHDFKLMRKKYSLFLTFFNIIITGSLFVIGFKSDEKIFIISLIVLIILFLILSFVYYLNFHFKMKKVKDKEKWSEEINQVSIVDISFRRERLVYSNIWFIIPLLIIIATTIYTFVVYEQIPDEIPIHTSVSGNITYDEKSIGIMLMMPIMQVFTLGIMLLINYIIKHSKQTVSVQNPERSKEQNIIFRRRWSLFIIIMSILMTILFTFIQFTFIYPSLIKYEDFVIYTVIGLILIYTILLGFNTGQGGSRVKIGGTENKSRIETDEDKHWKLGQFYFNRNDPSIFVEKRFGIGWTNNWAHPISWIFLITIIVLPLIIIYLLF